jgi:TonB family protein
MRIFKQTAFFFAGTAFFLFVFSNAVKAQARSITIKEQEATITYSSRMEIPDAAEPPKILGLPTFKYPESARKNGVEGKLTVSLTLGKNGTVQNVVAGENLPHGVTEAITGELKRLRFQPARKNGEPVDAKMFFDFVISARYGEKDRNITRLKIIENPDPVYPENQKAKGVSGKVYVSVLFSAGGSVEILGVRSTMPKEFNQAAAEAAKKIKFEPAVHKATNQKVSQIITLEYSFKP